LKERKTNVITNTTGVMNHLTVRPFRSRACRVYCQHAVIYKNNSPLSVSSSCDKVQLRGRVDILKNVVQTENYDGDIRQKKYDIWKEKGGQPPKDVLLDASGNEVVSPKIDPEFRIQGAKDGGSLPPALQHAVDQHVYWACQHEYAIPRKRHFVRHHKLDSRRSLKKTKKRTLKRDLAATPFVLIGAYQCLFKRAQQYPYGSDEEDPAGRNIRTANIPFSWFQTVSRVLTEDPGVKGILYTGTNSGKVNADVQALIVKEAMAMLMRPVLEPYLPPHSWYLESTDAEKGVLGDRWKYLTGTQQVEAIARSVDYNTDHHSMLLWDMGGDGKLQIGDVQLKGILNITRPYVSNWWSDQVSRFYNTHAHGIKRLKKWVLTEDKYSSLPSLLTEIQFMRLDFSETLLKNPLYRQIHDARKMGAIEARNLPTTLDQSDAHADYHRRGATICFAYNGPTKAKEKLISAVALELKSTLHFDKKIVNATGFTEKKPVGLMTAAKKKRRAQADAKFAEQEKRAKIALGGSKRLNNSKRAALQEEGRRLHGTRIRNRSRTAVRGING